MTQAVPSSVPGAILSERPSPGVAVIRINRPDKRNALDLPTRLALFDAVDAVLADDDVRAVVLTGNGGCFCAGGDVLSMQGVTLPQARARMKRGHRFVSALAGSEKPLLAAVDGAAAGAGASLAMLCDVVIAGPRARFSFPFLKLGLIPDWGLLHSLPGRVGMAAARRLLLEAAEVDAVEALRLGLADTLAEDGAVLEEAVARARQLAARPPLALALVRQGLRLAAPPLETVLEYEATAQAASLSGPEFAEGLAAFRDRRPAVFT